MVGLKFFNSLLGLLICIYVYHRYFDIGFSGFKFANIKEFGWKNGKS